MTDETGAPAGGEAIAAEAPVQDTGGELSISQAARLLSQSRYKDKDTPAESAEPATAETESASQEADAAPPEEATGETQEEAPAEKPSRDLPRSWTKDRAEIWNRLDPAAQDILLEQDRLASIEVRRSQNEAAEERKAAKAQREAAEQLRQQYEAKLPALMQQIHQQGPFADIKSQDDADKLAAEDPFRYLQWDAYQKRLAGMAYEAREVEARQTQERQTQWAQHVQKENELASEYIPELADKVKGPALTQRAADRLTELGFKSEELAKLASGQEKLSLYDHRIQRLIFSDLKLQDIQSAPKPVPVKDVPPVQRPGTSKPQGSTASAQLQALQEKFNRTGSLKDAQALHAAEMRRRA